MQVIRNSKAAPPGRPYPGRRPTVVVWTTVVLGVNLAFELARCVIYSAIGFSTVAVPLTGLAMLWTWSASAFLMGPVWEGRRWGWSGVVGGLFVKTAVALGFCAWLAAEAIIRDPARPRSYLPSVLITYVLTYAAVAGVLAWKTFAARGWFGIPARGAWRALLREGWWALAMTALLDVGAVVNGVWPR
jgi:hypothetical protein